MNIQWVEATIGVWYCLNAQPLADRLRAGSVHWGIQTFYPAAYVRGITVPSACGRSLREMLEESLVNTNLAVGEVNERTLTIYRLTDVR
jgi:hypothetical protein